MKWRLWRNRLLSSPRFQDLATRFPLTRPVARKRARALFDLVAGFTYSQTLAACVELRLIDLLAEDPLSAEAVAVRTGLPIESADTLLRAAAAIDLTARIGSLWTLGSAGAALRGNGGLAEMIAHHRTLYADLADPVALLRRGGGGGELSRYWQYAEQAGSGDAEQVAPYSRLMAASQPMISGQVIRAYRFGRHRRLLDVGGGEGAFLTAVAASAPRLELGLFDLQAVGDRARTRFADAGLAERTIVHAGSFLTDPLPPGYDIISLIRVLHDHDDAPAMALLRNVHAALDDGAALLIAEPMAETPGAEPAGDAYFGLYLLAMGSGRPRSPAVIRAMLREAGFRSIKVLRTALPLTTRAILAVK